MYFQNVNAFTYQKRLRHTLLLLVFKIIESLECILKLQSVVYYTIVMLEYRKYLSEAFLVHFLHVISTIFFY